MTPRSDKRPTKAQRRIPYSHEFRCEHVEGVVRGKADYCPCDAVMYCPDIMPKRYEGGILYCEDCGIMAMIAGWKPQPLPKRTPQDEVQDAVIAQGWPLKGESADG